MEPNISVSPILVLDFFLDETSPTSKFPLVFKHLDIRVKTIS